MSFDSFVFLRFPAPFSFFLCFYESSTVILLSVFRSVLTYVSVEGRVVYLIFLKSSNVLVQLFFGFSVGGLVISGRVREIGSMELKVRWVIDRQLLWRS